MGRKPLATTLAQAAQAKAAAGAPQAAGRARDAARLAKQDKGTNTTIYFPQDNVDAYVLLEAVERARRDAWHPKTGQPKPSKSSSVVELIERCRADLEREAGDRLAMEREKWAQFLGRD
jgi:hypothetical protein